MIGGFVNAVGFLGLAHEALSHLTGTTTQSALALVLGDWSAFGHTLAVLLAYTGGAVLSGIIVQQSTLQLGRRYGVALFVESLLLFAATPLLLHHLRWGDYLATCACGLQNGMVTSYSGAVIRTTHMSGIVTDLGILLGHGIRGLPVDRKRLQLGLMLFLSFFAGSAVGAILFSRFSYAALLFPATLTGLIGISYSVYRHQQRYRQRQA